jgi:hypothetical protein
VSEKDNPPRHPDCVDCKFFRRPRENPICAGCGVGEFFQERVVVRTQPSYREVMTLWRQMTRDSGDE